MNTTKSSTAIPVTFKVEGAGKTFYYFGEDMKDAIAQHREAEPNVKSFTIRKASRYLQLNLN